MLFIDQIQEKSALLAPEFDQLFQLALTTQAHPGDLLLLLENGAYEPDIQNFQGGNNSPYVIGPGRQGWSYNTHYKFIDNYRQRVYKSTYVEYLAEYQSLTDKQNWDERNVLEEGEGLTIQLETLIYQKIWESDSIIKRLYEFVRILLGEPYDWTFKLAEGPRPRAGESVRNEVLRLQIRDRVQPVSQVLYDSLLTAYKSQVRNSIAHSNYSLQGRHIQLNNYNPSNHAPLRAISFDDWINMFHHTMLIYNELIGLTHSIRTHYAAIAAVQNNEIEVLVPDRNGQLQPRIIVYRPEFEDFRWKQ